MSSGFVCLMGIGIVFVGLIAIVIICKIMSFFVTRFVERDNKTEVKAAVQPTQAPALPLEEKRAVIAGVCAVIAEEIGTDVENIRVLSFKAV